MTVSYSPETLILKNAAANGPLTEYVESAINDAYTQLKAYVDAALNQANTLLAEANQEHEDIIDQLDGIQAQLDDQLNTDKYAVTRESIVRLMQSLGIYE